MQKTYDTATLDELEAEFKALAEELSRINARRQELAVLMSRRKAEASARVKLGAMKPLERDALKRVLDTEF